MANFQVSASENTFGAGVLLAFSMTAASFGGMNQPDSLLPQQPYIATDEEIARKTEVTSRVDTQNTSSTFTEHAAHKKFLVRLIDTSVAALDEGVIISNASIKDAMAFVSGLIRDGKDYANAPHVAAYDNGNVRLIWKNHEGEQIGLTFLGKGVIQYVILVKARGSGKRVPQTGRIELSKASGVIDAHGVSRLIYG